MPQLTNLILLVSLVSLASIAKCRPLETFDLTDPPLLDGQPLATFNADSIVPELSQTLAETNLADFDYTKLEIPAGSSPNFFPFEIASGPSCGNPDLNFACCSGSLFNSGSCVWGSVCESSQLQLCCGRIGDASPGNCEPPKYPPTPPRVTTFEDGSSEVPFAIDNSAAGFPNSGPQSGIKFNSISPDGETIINGDDSDGPDIFFRR